MVSPLAWGDYGRVYNEVFDRILGQSAAAEAMRAFGQRAAAVDAPVLLLGESGTGKGILARAIHDASPRARRAFIAINCAAVPEALFESEFFGHVRGAFTGAQYAHKGLFEQADGGTLFLDEIGELPLTSQAKLLTAIEDRLVRRVGGERTSQIDARIIAATAVDLQQAARAGKFRGDLYHRLSVLLFQIAPLRERTEDIAEMALHMIQSCCARYRLAPIVMEGDGLKALLKHDWPGNVRELANAIERAIISSGTRGLCFEHLSRTGSLYRNTPASPQSTQYEEARIEAALQAAGGNKTRAAAALGIARTTLWSRLKQMDGMRSGDEQS